MIYCRSQADADSFPFVSTHNRHHLWRQSIPAKTICWIFRCSNVVDTIHIVRYTYRFRWSSQTLRPPKQRQWEVQQTTDAIIRAKQSAADLWTASFSQSKLNVIVIKRNLRISVAVAGRSWLLILTYGLWWRQNRNDIPTPNWKCSVFYSVCGFTCRSQLVVRIL